MDDTNGKKIHCSNGSYDCRRLLQHAARTEMDVMTAWQQHQQNNNQNNQNKNHKNKNNTVFGHDNNYNTHHFTTETTEPPIALYAHTCGGDCTDGTNPNTNTVNNRNGSTGSRNNETTDTRTTNCDNSSSSSGGGDVDGDGDTDPPLLVVLVAYTKHTITAQLMYHQYQHHNNHSNNHDDQKNNTTTDNRNPMNICTILPFPNDPTNTDAGAASTSIDIDAFGTGCNMDVDSITCLTTTTTTTTTIIVDATTTKTKIVGDGDIHDADAVQKQQQQQQPSSSQQLLPMADAVSTPPPTKVTTHHHDTSDIGVSKSSSSSSSSSTSTSSSITKSASLMRGMMMMETDKDETNHINEEKENDNVVSDDNHPTTTHTPTTTLVQPKQLRHRHHHQFAIVFGTAHGHVYTIEMCIHRRHNNHNSNNNSVTNTADVNTNNSYHNNNNDGYHYYYTLQRIQSPLSTSCGGGGRYMFPVVIHPLLVSYPSWGGDRATGSHTTTMATTTDNRRATSMDHNHRMVVGVQSLSTTNIDHHNSYIWIVYHNNNSSSSTVAIVRVHSRCCFPITNGLTEGNNENTTTSLVGGHDIHHRDTVEEYILQKQQQQGRSIDDRSFDYSLDENMILRCEVHLPQQSVPQQNIVVVPLPQYVPSTMAPLQDICNQYMVSSPSSQSNVLPRDNFVATRDDTIMIDDSTVPLYHYPMTQQRKVKHEQIQVLVYFPNDHNHGSTVNDYSDLNPTFAFYTSEGTRTSIVHSTTNNDEQRSSSLRKPVNMSPTDAVVDVNADDNNVDDDDDDGILLVSVTKAIVGTAFGAIRWGLTGRGGNNKSNDQSNNGDERNNHRSSPKRRSRHVQDGSKDMPQNPHDVDRRAVIGLHLSSAFHDLPRTVEFCTVDPGGKLIATADVLGRILLIDIATKQIIRMWKGHRDATCYWIQQLQPNTARSSKSSNRPKSKVQLFLLIHSRQRRIIEIWPVRYGDRVSTMSVSRDAKVIPVTTFSTSSDGRQVKLAQCYVTQSTLPSSNLAKLEMVRVSNPETDKSIADENIPILPNSPIRNKSGKNAHANTKLSGVSVRNGALRLKHLQQLLSANQMQCSIDDVRNALHDITSMVDLATAIDLLATSPGLEANLNIDGTSFHKEVVSYCRDVLSAAMQPNGNILVDPSIRKNPHVQVLSQKIVYHEQLLKAFDTLNKFGTAPCDSNVQQVKSPSHWAAEAMAWASTHERVTKIALDKDISRMPLHRLRFTDFASSCKFPEVSPSKTSVSFKIFFSDSSRSRRTIVEHVFKPLLGDAFSITATDSVFDALGIRSDFQYKQLCFAEWFETLSIRETCKKGLYADFSPMIHFLHALTLQQLSLGPVKDNDVVLGSIFQFCKESTDLVRAFMLGAVCLEAVTKAVTQIDKVPVTKDAARLVSDWKSLLRMIRMCLLVSLRLHGNKMVAPITIDNTNQPDIFSIFEWLALDELSMSHNHDEIVSLEKACSISSYAFDPSLPDGDGPSRFKMLQSSCLAAAATEEERAEYLVDFNDDDRFGALLLFLSSHNVPKILAANRALLLATKWGSNPKILHFIYDAIVALKSLSKTNGFKALASAVCVEIWQSRLCPIYRAYMFGFADIQELSEDIVSPLIQDKDWLTAVCRIGLQLLAILQECKLENPSEFVFELEDKGKSWPSFRSDFKLQKLIDKMPRQVDESALNIHSVVLCAFLVSSDIEALAQCIPTLHELYLPCSLFQPMINSTNVPELQQRYLNNAITTFSKQYTAPALESFDLGEIVTLAKVWSFNLGSVRTLFLLSMYELGKDALVDELVTKASFLIDGNYFVEGGVSIACVRLNFFLNGGRMHSVSLRNAIGVLDAELCEWVKQRALRAVSLVEHTTVDIDIGSTHLFVMRLLSISVSSNVDKELRVRIHSLAVLSGILMKAISDV